MTTGVSPRVVAGASLSAVVLAVLLLGFKGLVLWAGAGVLVYLLSRYFSRAWAGSPETSWARPTKLSKWRSWEGLCFSVDLRCASFFQFRNFLVKLNNMSLGETPAQAGGYIFRPLP